MAADNQKESMWISGTSDWSIQEATFAPLYEKIISHFPSGGGKSLLDIGCGTGLFLSLTPASKYYLTGVDISSDAIEKARQRVPHASFLETSMENLPFDDESFDIIVGNNSFQYAYDPERALSEVQRTLRPSGTLLLSLWGNPSECDSFSYFSVFYSAMRTHHHYPMPFNLTEDGKIEELLLLVGLMPGRRVHARCLRQYPDRETALRGILSSGPAASAIRHAGHEQISREVIEAIAPYQKPDGSYSMENQFFFLSASRIE